MSFSALTAFTPSSSRQLHRTLLAAAALALGALTVPATALAQSFVSIKNNVVSIRAKPQAKAEVQWELSRGYPLQVSGRQGAWIKVRDYESTLGWVQKSQTSNQGHHVVKARVANLRSQANDKSSIVGKLSQHEVVKTLGKRNNWVQVQTSGGKQGWVSAPLVWGF